MDRPSQSSRSHKIGQQIHQTHNSHLFNPNWEEAEKHGKASKVGFVHQKDGQEERCSCCLEHVEKQQIPMNQNTKQLEFLGFGFPLYYAFVRNCILLLLVTVCSYNIISIYESVYRTKIMCNKLDTQHTMHHLNNLETQFTHRLPEFGLRHFNEKIPHGKPHENKQLGSTTQGEQKEGKEEQEKPLQCESFFILIARTQKTVQFYEQLLRGGSFVVHLILLIYIRDKLIKLKQYFDERTTSLSDYSLMVTNLPQIKRIRHQLSTKIEKEYNEKLVQIILIPDFKELEVLEQKKNHLIEKLRSGFKNKQQKSSQTQNEKECNEIHNQLELTELQIQKFITQEKEGYRNDELEATLAIIIINTEPQKNELLEKFEAKKLSGDLWKDVEMEEAPEPKEIIWQNVFLSQKKKASLTCFGWLLSILVLAVLTIVFALVSKQKSKMIQVRMHEYRHGKQHNMKYFLESLFIVFGMIFFVVLFNKMIMSNLFHKFTDLERHSSTYKFQFSFCLKYCLGLFFTTALMTVIVQAIIVGNYYKQDYGVVQQQTIMFLINSFFVPVFWAINPTYLYNRYKKNKHYGQKHLTQKQANQLMQFPEYDVGKRYAEVLEIMWFTFLYLTLIPIGGIISCIGIGFYYWVDKYNLLRRSSIHSSVSGGLLHLTLNLLDFTLTLRMIGEILFDYQTRDGVRLSSFVFFTISLAYQFIPVEPIIQFFNHEKFKTEKTPYSVAKSEFKHTYYDEHALFSMLKQDRQNLINMLVNKIILQNSKKSMFDNKK